MSSATENRIWPASLHYVTEACRNCGQPIDAISPEWYRIVQRFEEGKVEWSYQPDEMALCTGCTVKKADSDGLHNFQQTYAEPLLAWRSAASLPECATMFHHQIDNRHIHPIVNAVFNVRETFCHVKGQIPEDWTIPYRTIFQDDGTPPIHLMYAGILFQLQGVEATVRIFWDHSRPFKEGDLRIEGWSRCLGSDISRLIHAISYFLPKRPSHRPPGTTTWQPEEIVAAIHVYFSEHSEEENWKPRLNEFQLRFGYSASTWKRNMKRWKSTWHEMLRRAGY